MRSLLLTVAALHRGIAARGRAGHVLRLHRSAAYLNANRPANHENFIPGTGTSGKRANELMLNLAQVQWSRAATPRRPVGFTLALVAGEGADVVHAGGAGRADAFRHVYQASLAYRLRNGVCSKPASIPRTSGWKASTRRTTGTTPARGSASSLLTTRPASRRATRSTTAGRRSSTCSTAGRSSATTTTARPIGTQLAYTSGPLTASFNTFVDRSRRFGDVVRVLGDSRSILPRCSSARPSTSARRSRSRGWRGAGALCAVRDRRAPCPRRARRGVPRSRRGISGTAQTLREATLTYELRPREHLILKTRDALRPVHGARVRRTTSARNFSRSPERW